MTVAASVAGIALIFAAFRDIFQTLFFPSGRGSLSRILMRVTWHVFKSLSRRWSGLLVFAGPAAVLLVILSWILLLSAGWALLYWPHMPAGFALEPGLPPAGERSLVEAIYLSIVTLATLGYGDIVPTSGYLRILAPLQALVGFGLLTASLSWVLSIYPALTQRQTLARDVSLTCEAESRSGLGLADIERSSSVEQLLANLTSQLAAVHGNIIQFPVLYYFRSQESRTAIPAVLILLYELAERAGSDDRPPVRLQAARLKIAVEELAGTLNAEFIRLPDASTRDILKAYTRDHRHTPPGEEGS